MWQVDLRSEHLIRGEGPGPGCEVSGEVSTGNTSEGVGATRLDKGRGDMRVSRTRSETTTESGTPPPHRGWR